MSSEFNNVPEIDDTPSVRISVAEQVLIANARAHEARRVPLTAALTVASRVLAKSPYEEATVRAFAVERAVDRFLELATKGARLDQLHLEHTDLLPVGHPSSTAVTALTASAVRQARAAWISGDPRIDDTVRPLVAAAYGAKYGSVEHKHAVTRLRVLSASLVPIDIALLADGNSSVERSIRAEAQLRDNEGKFAEQGKGGSLKASVGKLIKTILGIVVGGSDEKGHAEIYISKDDPELGLKKGDILKGNIKNFTAVGVALTEEELERAGIEMPAGSTSLDADAQPIEELLANKLEAPSDWTKDKDGNFNTGDGFKAIPLGDNKYAVNDDKGNPIAGLEAAEWPEIQAYLVKEARSDKKPAAVKKPAAPETEDAPGDTEMLDISALEVGDHVMHNGTEMLVRKIVPNEGKKTWVQLKSADGKLDFIEAQPTDKIERFITPQVDIADGQKVSGGKNKPKDLVKMKASDLKVGQHIWQGGYWEEQVLRDIKVGDDGKITVSTTRPNGKKRYGGEFGPDDMVEVLPSSITEAKPASFVEPIDDMKFDGSGRSEVVDAKRVQRFEEALDRNLTPEEKQMLSQSGAEYIYKQGPDGKVVGDRGPVEAFWDEVAAKAPHLYLQREFLDPAGFKKNPKPGTYKPQANEPLPTWHPDYVEPMILDGTKIPSVSLADVEDASLPARRSNVKVKSTFNDPGWTGTFTRNFNTKEERDAFVASIPKGLNAGVAVFNPSNINKLFPGGKPLRHFQAEVSLRWVEEGKGNKTQQAAAPKILKWIEANGFDPSVGVHESTDRVEPIPVSEIPSIGEPLPPKPEVKKPSVTPADAPAAVADMSVKPKNPPSPSQIQMIRSMLLERVMTPEQRQTYMDRLAKADKGDINGLFNEIKSNFKWSKTKLTDKTDPLNQSSDSKIAALKQSIAHFDLDGSIRRMIDEQTANGPEGIDVPAIQAALDNNWYYKKNANPSNLDASDDAAAARNIETGLKSLDKTVANKAAELKERVAKLNEKAKKNRAEMEKFLFDLLSAKGSKARDNTTLGEYQVALDTLEGLLGDMDKNNVMDRIRSGELYDPKDVRDALGLEPSNTPGVNQESQFGKNMKDLTNGTKSLEDMPEMKAVLEAVYGLPNKPEGTAKEELKYQLKKYDKENGELAYLIDSGAPGNEITNWLENNSPAWNDRVNDYKTSGSVDFPTKSQLKNWKSTENLINKIDAWDGREPGEELNQDFINGVSELLPPNTVVDLNAKLLDDINGGTLIERLGGIRTEQDLQDFSYDVMSYNLTNKNLSPQQQAGLNQVLDAAMQHFYASNPELKDVVDEPANIVIPVENPTGGPIGQVFDNAEIDKGLYDSVAVTINDAVAEGILPAGDYPAGNDPLNAIMSKWAENPEANKQQALEELRALSDAFIWLDSDEGNFHAKFVEKLRSGVEDYIPYDNLGTDEQPESESGYGKKEYTNDYGSGPEKTLVDGDALYKNANDLKDLYKQAEEAGVSKKDLEFGRGQIGLIWKDLDNTGDFENAASSFITAEDELRTYINKIKSPSVRAELLAKLDEIKANQKNSIETSKEPWLDQLPKGDLYDKSVYAKEFVDLMRDTPLTDEQHASLMQHLDDAAQDAMTEYLNNGGDKNDDAAQMEVNDAVYDAAQDWLNSTPSAEPAPQKAEFGSKDSYKKGDTVELSYDPQNEGIGFLRSGEVLEPTAPGSSSYYVKLNNSPDNGDDAGKTVEVNIGAMRPAEPSKTEQPKNVVKSPYYTIMDEIGMSNQEAIALDKEIDEFLATGNGSLSEYSYDTNVLNNIINDWEDNPIANKIQAWNRLETIAKEMDSDNKPELAERVRKVAQGISNYGVPNDGNIANQTNKPNWSFDFDLQDLGYLAETYGLPEKEDDYTESEFLDAWLKKHGLDKKGVKYAPVEPGATATDVDFEIPDSAKDAFAKAYLGQDGESFWKNVADGDYGTPIGGEDDGGPVDLDPKKMYDSSIYSRELVEQQLGRKLSNAEYVYFKNELDDTAQTAIEDWLNAGGSSKDPQLRDNVAYAVEMTAEERLAELSAKGKPGKTGSKSSDLYDKSMYTKEEVEAATDRTMSDEEYQNFKNHIDDAANEAMAEYLNNGGSKNDAEAQDAVNDAVSDAAFDWLNSNASSGTEAAANPFSSENSDKALAEAGISRGDVAFADVDIETVLDNNPGLYIQPLSGIAGNSNVLKNILDSLDESNGANNISLYTQLVELGDALESMGVELNTVEKVRKLADVVEEFVPAGGDDNENGVTIATIIDEQNRIIGIKDWIKIGGQKGSNEGGTYKDPKTGEEYYVKTPKSKLHAENERLAAAIYKALGIPSANVIQGINPNGTPFTLSPMIEGATPNLKKKMTDKDYLARLQQGFAVDALLANWDVIGLQYDNIVTDANGDPVRVDPGGALLFRAQGEPKGDSFGETVPELASFTDPTSNRPAAKVFSSMTPEQKEESAKLLQNLTPSQIDELVNSIVTDPAKREELKAKLKARREFILNHFGLTDGGEGPSPVAPEAPSAPSAAKPEKSPTITVTGAKLSDGNIGNIGTKVVHIKTGETGTIVKFGKNPNYAEVQGPDGKKKLKSINQLKVADDGNGGGGSNAPEPTAPEAPNSSESTDATNQTMSDGSPATIGTQVVHTGTGETGTIVGYAKSPGYVNVQGADGKKKLKSVNKLKAVNPGTSVDVDGTPAPEAAKKETGDPNFFNFDYLSLPTVEDAPALTMPTDPLDSNSELYKTDSQGTIIAPGTIVKDNATGKIGVYRTLGFGDPNKIRVSWEDGDTTPVDPSTVTSVGKKLDVGIAGVYTSLADLDFVKHSEEMPDGLVSVAHDKDGNFLHYRQLVVDKNGDVGVILQNKGTFDGYITVAYPDGNKKRKADTLTGMGVRYTKPEYKLKNGQKQYTYLYNNANSDYGLPTFGKKTGSGGKAVEPGKIPVPKNAAGAKPKEVRVVPWNEADLENTPSLEALLASVSDTNTPGAGLRGGSIALDSDAVEDLDLRIMSAQSSDGKDAFLLKYKLTNWAGDDLANQLVELVKNGDPRVTLVPGMTLPENIVDGDKVSFMPSLKNTAGYKSPYGETYVITLDDGTVVHFMRADTPSKHPGGAIKMHADAPKAYHNKVMIIAPKENSTPETLALALQTGGVQEVRPSTKEDARILIENRLMSIFDEKVDPKTNLSGAKRAESLARIKADWGIGPENVTITTGAGGRIEMRLDADSAKKLAAKTGIHALRHQLSGSGWSQSSQNAPANETPEEYLDRAAEYFVSRMATPQGGLLSTTTRWSEGVPSKGMSSMADVKTGGADYVFTTPVSEWAVASNVTSVVPQLYFDPELTFQRLDFWANKGDEFGKRKGKSPIKQAVPGGYEVMFKGRLSFDDAKVILVKDQAMRTRIITKLRQRGITELGGRPLEAVIMTGPDYSAAKNTVI